MSLPLASGRDLLRLDRGGQHFQIGVVTSGSGLSLPRVRRSKNPLAACWLAGAPVQPAHVVLGAVGRVRARGLDMWAASVASSASG
jgi:hypothetical protein